MIEVVRVREQGIPYRKRERGRQERERERERDRLTQRKEDTQLKTFTVLGPFFKSIRFSSNFTYKLEKCQDFKNTIKEWGNGGPFL